MNHKINKQINNQMNNRPEEKITHIAIFGGTFDPVHLGHCAVIKAVLDNFNYDKLFIVPAVISNFKNKSPRASGLDRMMMLKLSVDKLIKNNKGFKDKVVVSDIELKREGVSYTSDTVREIKNKISECKVDVVLGDDHVNKLSEWHDIDYLIKNVRFVFYKRMEFQVDLNLLPSGIDFIYLKLDRIYKENSTEIRENIDKYKNYLDDDVRKYIYSKGLYRS